MKSVFLSSVLECSGKSMVALGIAKNYSGKVGYFKPFREDILCINDRPVDRDAHLMKHALGLDASEEMLSPLKYDIFHPASIGTIVDNFNRVKGEAEGMVVEGAQLLSTGARQHVDGLSIAKAIDADDSARNYAIA